MITADVVQHPAAQIVAATVAASSYLGALPSLCLIPPAIYYLVATYFMIHEHFKEKSP